MKVLFVTQYGTLAASSRTRVFQYLPYLHDSGIQTRVITVLPDGGIGRSQLLVTHQRWRKIVYYLWATYRTIACGIRTWVTSGAFDLLFIQKVIFPAPFRWLLGLRRLRIAYDFDDAIFTTEVRDGNWLSAWKQRRNRSGLPGMLRLADLVFVENDYTSGYAASFCANIAIITGPIDTIRYSPLSTAADRDRGKPLVLGWIGSATTISYLEVIRSPLQQLGRRFPNLRLSIVGAETQIEGVNVESAAWSLENEVEQLAAFDIGLMPMPDDPWTRGKGGYKLLQYMSMGLPVVTSPVGINRQIVEDGAVGYVASSSREWEDRLAELIEDSELRSTMGARGRARVEADYSLELSSRKLVQLLKDLVGNP